jgi:hypothetical protein
MMLMRKIVLLALITLLVWTSSAHAWSYKEHILMTRLAAGRIMADDDAPEGLKDFVREHCPEAEAFDLRDFVMNVHVGRQPEGYDGLAFWSIHPDFDRSTPVPAFNSTEGKMHYINLELFNKDPQKRRYFDDLSGLPDLADIPRDPDDPRFQEAGFLPFRIEQCYNELVKAFAAGDDESAVIWAGYLAHYLQDNTQPHHATVDYKSHSYFEHLPEDERPNVHAWMEWGFIDDGQPSKFAALRDLYQFNVTRLLAQRPVVKELDMFEHVIKQAAHQSSYLHGIGEGALAAVSTGHREEDQVRLFFWSETHPGKLAAIWPKLSSAVSSTIFVESAWRQAWAEAQGEYERPAEQRTAKLTTRPATLPTRE